MQFVSHNLKKRMYHVKRICMPCNKQNQISVFLGEKKKNFCTKNLTQTNLIYEINIVVNYSPQTTKKSSRFVDHFSHLPNSHYTKISSFVGQFCGEEQKKTSQSASCRVRGAARGAPNEARRLTWPRARRLSRRADL